MSRANAANPQDTGCTECHLHALGNHTLPLPEEAEVPTTEERKTIMREKPSTPARALYDVPEAMALLSLSRTQIYELIRSRRLVIGPID
jgi:hypothetical protein